MDNTFKEMLMTSIKDYRLVAAHNQFIESLNHSKEEENRRLDIKDTIK